MAMLVMAALMSQAGAAQNLLVNPRVEDHAEPWRTWPRRGQPEFAFDTTTGHGDTTSVRIAALEEGVDGSWLQAVAGEGGVPYDYSFWFRTDPPGGIVSFLAEFGAADGQYAGQHRRELKAEGDAWTHAEGSFVAPESAVNIQFEVWVNLDNVGQGTAWFDDFSLVSSNRPLVSMTLEEPLYHILRPGEERLRCRLRQSNPRAAAPQVTVELRRGEQLLEQQTGTVERDTPLDVPAASITEDGTYVLSVRAEAEGEAVFESDETIVRRRKPPLVDIGRHRELVVEGEPLFPIGVYWARREDLEDVAANGFNCVHAWLYPNEEGRAFFAEAQRLGLRLVLEMSDTLRGQTALGQIEERVAAFREEPALLCYYPVDEPSPPSTDPAGMREAYNLIKALDSDHPIMHVQCNMAFLDTYVGATDILAVDPYGSLDMVQQWVNWASEASAGRQPAWVVIGTFPWQGLPGFPGLPSAEYVRAAAYAALICGARGILYFSYHFGEHALNQSELWEPLGQLNAEMARLAPWLLAGDPEAVGTSDDRVIAASFRRGESVVVLAANKSDAEAVDAELELPGMRGAARPVWGGDTLRCDEKLLLHLEPYGTAALELLGEQE